ncbi:murein transglycosylase A [Chitinimonas lacunae]|uniref:peptidoglycan lytic exotransglycosylase n=1 Tax=Chitinimonas lacunae TaxID=1963018 RepID=A0ABV8MMC7_9NEIS
MRRISLCLLATLLAACTTTPPVSPTVTPTTPPDKPVPQARFVSASWSQLPGWPSDNLLAGWPAWLQSCKRLANKPAWRDVCRSAQTLAPRDDSAVRRYLETHFQPYRVESTEGRDSGLVTGYYEPLLRGSRQPRSGYYPIHGVPDDLLTIELGSLYPELKGLRLRGRLSGTKVLPYWSHAEITAGMAPLTGKELAWVDDPIEAFFLQVQGSGRVRLEDGSLLRVGYADQNGHPYRSIGKWLIDKGELKPEEASMQGIQAWARANPARIPELLHSNPSYVFFRILPDAQGGPIGALGVPLTDGASVAVDPRHIPLGTPLYLSTTWPNDSRALRRLMYAQDTGGAIRGPIRVDFFWGFGHEAGMLAGKMKQQGQVWLVWPREAPPPGQESRP